MSIKARLQTLEKMMVKSEALFRIDSEGWQILGGGKRAAGVLRVPPRMSETEWLAAGNTAKKTALTSRLTR